MPPSLFAPIVENLGKAGLLEGSRVAVEKPFGHDLTSARELNERLRALLDEDQIFRVDHFLGKEPVVELEYLRFGNLALVELWNRTCHLRNPDHHGRELRRRRPGQVLRRGRRSARCRAEPSASGAGRIDDGAPGRAERGRCQRQKVRHFAGDASGGPGSLCPGSVSRLHRRRRGGQGFDDRDFRRTAAGDQQLALGRGADLPAGGQGTARTRHRGAIVHPPGSLAELSCRIADGSPDPTRSCCASTPIPDCGCS